LIGWHLVVAMVFAFFFAFDGLLMRFWPLALVLAGLGLLARSALRRQDTVVGKV
jgi:hypothetical protein